MTRRSGPPVDGRHDLGLSPWTGEFADPARESAARGYLGDATGSQYSSVQLLASVIIGLLWLLDVQQLGLGRESAVTLAVRLSLLVVWAVDRPRIRANPRVGIDGLGMTVGQGLAVVFVLVVAWVRPHPASIRQLDAFIVAIAILMVFANQARRRMVLSAAVLVGTDLVLLVRAPTAESDLVPVLLDHAAGWLFGVMCSVTLNASRRRSYVHWSAERAARDSLDEEAARRREVERELTRLAERDDLTDLPNRRVFLARAEEALAAAREVGRPLCALVLDADHFKRVNDEWGHQVGDDVLRHLTAGLRVLDRSGHIVGRLGGEEFGIIVLSGEARAMDLADRVRTGVAEGWFFVGDEVLQLTMSIGVAMAGPQDGVADVLRRADEALYVAKREGRDRVRVAG